MLIKHSRCLTCERLKRHTDITCSRDANRHQQNFPDHHVQIVSDFPEQGEKLRNKFAPALVIPKAHGELDCRAYVTQDLFSSYLDAKSAFSAEDDYTIIWPATHDSEGYYTVSE